MPFGYRTIGLAREIAHRKESTNLAFLEFLRRRKAQEFGIQAGLSGSAELGDWRLRSSGNNAELGIMFRCSDPFKCNLVFADAEFQFTFLTQQR